MITPLLETICIFFFNSTDSVWLYMYILINQHIQISRENISFNTKCWWNWFHLMFRYCTCSTAIVDKLTNKNEITPKPSYCKLTLHVNIFSYVTNSFNYSTMVSFTNGLKSKVHVYALYSNNDKNYP